MRTVAIVLLSVLFAFSVEAAPCEYESGAEPLLRVSKRYSVLQSSIRCEAGASGMISTTIFARRNGKKKKIKSFTKTIEANPKWSQNFSYMPKVDAKDYCIESFINSNKPEIAGIGHRQKNVGEVELEFQVVGMGDLSALSWRARIKPRCPLCGRGGGQFRLMNGRSGAASLTSRQKTALIGKAKKEWFECARRGSRIDFRLFDDRDGRAKNAIRPAFVIKDLQRRFKRKGDKYVFEQPIRYQKICRIVGKGHHRLMWEVLGRGQLASIGPGARSNLKISCP